MRNLLFFFLIALAPIVGCTESNIIIGGDGGGADSGQGVDAGSFDAGSGIACGANTCRQGTVCCNASCGTCVEPGESCTTIECTQPVVCDGNVCADTAVCCGGCPGEQSSCSGPGGECPPVSCTGPICGGEACSADSLTCCAGCNGEEICSGPGGECPAIDCPPPGPCDAQDVRFEGGCEPGLRFWWNGSECVGDTGCECVGAGCDDTFGDSASCEAAYAMCTMPPGDCDVDHAQGEGDCRILFGFAWNGFSCNEVSGCECIGACDTLHLERADCEAAHAGCSPPPTCESDLECGIGNYCDSCARGSCEVCEDCVSGCLPHGCPGEGEVICDAIAPECGPEGVAVASGGCWECVNVRTCERLDEPEM